MQSSALSHSGMQGLMPMLPGTETGGHADLNAAVLDVEVASGAAQVRRVQGAHVLNESDHPGLVQRPRCNHHQLPSMLLQQRILLKRC